MDQPVVPFRKADERHNVSLERGTDGVPHDGRFHLVVDGTVVYSTRVEASAVIEYEEVRDARREAALAVLHREQGYFDAQRLRSESSGRQAAAARRKGGKGGKGGVG